MDISKNIPSSGIKLSFIDNDGRKVNGISVKQANEVAKKYPNKKFYFQNGDGVEKKLTIKQVNKLLSKDLLPSAPSCPTDPEVCGPPRLKVFGKGGLGVAANVIISPVSSSVIGFDILNSGFGFLGAPSAELIDSCGKGSGAKLEVNMEDDDEDTTGIGEITGTGTGTGGTGTGTGTGGTGTGTGGTGTGTGGTGTGTGGTGTGTGGTGTSGSSVTSGGVPITAGGSSVTAGGSGGTSVTAGGALVTAGGTGGSLVTAGGSGGVPLVAGETFLTINGTPITSGATGGTPVISNGVQLRSGASGGTPITVGSNISIVSNNAAIQQRIIDECESPRNSFKNKVLNEIGRSKKIKNITIIAPGDGYIAAPDGSLGGNERVWKEPDEGYVKTKCGGYYVVQPYRPIMIRAGDTYYPPDGPPRVMEEDEVVTLPFVPVTPSNPDSLGVPYSVLLCIEEIKVLDGGYGYRPGDQLIVTPNNGTIARLIVDENGSISRVELERGGCGYSDLPNLRTNSPTGFNAIFSTIFKPIRIDPSLPIDPQVEGSPVTVGGTGGSPVTSGGLPVVVGGTGGIPVSVGGSGIPVVVDKDPLLYEKTPLTSGGDGGTPIQVSPFGVGSVIPKDGQVAGQPQAPQLPTGATPLTAGGEGGVPLIINGIGGNPLIIDGKPVIVKVPSNKFNPFSIPENVELVTVIDCVGKIPPKTQFDIVPR